MEQIIKTFIEGKQKTNLHALLCLKKIYIDDKRPLDQSFQQGEVSRMWATVASINPTFLNADVAPVYMTKQQFISKVGQDLFIVEQYRDAFQQIDWDIVVQQVAAIKPLFAPIYDYLLQNKSNFIEYVFTILEQRPDDINQKLIPALLEISAYAVLKTHLNYYGADILRWTRTNSNDGGVDMTCGNVCYSITTNLNERKMDSDAAKQVRDRLNFITLTNNVDPKKIAEIEESRGLKINVIELSDLKKIINNFSDAQEEQLLSIFNEEIMKEI
jgi:hypothetical protein